MTDRKNVDEACEPIKRGYQPTPQKPPVGDKVQGGYQPPASEGKPVQPPPKKP